MFRKLSAWFRKKGISFRLVIAVAFGIVLSKVLVLITHWIFYKLGIFPPLGEPMFYTRHLVIALAFHSAYAILAAYVTAHIAKQYAGRAVFILGTKEAVMWLIGIVLLWHHAPPWFNLVKAVLGIPLSVFGGWLYVQRHKHIFKTT